MGLGEKILGSFGHIDNMFFVNWVINRLLNVDGHQVRIGIWFVDSSSHFVPASADHVLGLATYFNLFEHFNEFCIIDAFEREKLINGVIFFAQNFL